MPMQFCFRPRTLENGGDWGSLGRNWGALVYVSGCGRAESPAQPPGWLCDASPCVSAGQAEGGSTTHGGRPHAQTSATSDLRQHHGDAARPRRPYWRRCVCREHDRQLGHHQRPGEVPDIGTGQVQSVDVRDDTLANGGLGSADIANNTVASGDIENGGVGGVDIANGDLNDEDVGQAAFVDFAADVGSVAAHDCDFDQITGVGAAKGDHLLLTGSGVDTHPSLTYAVQYQLSGGAAWVRMQPD